MSNYAALTLLFYAILYLFQLIKGAVLENRQPYTHPPTARYDVVNLVVTKVVQITNTTDSSSDALNASEETSAFTQAASVESMTESLAHAQSGHGECRRSHCRVDVAVSGSLRRNAEEVLRDNPVRVRILLAPRIPEYGMSFDDYQLPSATPKEGLNL